MEIILAVRVEQLLTKQQILDYYLNIVQLGPGVYGLREGARFYFNKEPEDLSHYQAALLAYFIPRPNDYGKVFASGKPSKHRKDSVRRILKRMVRQNYLAPEMLGEKK